MLVRRFIGRRLAEYYAQPSHKVVGRSTELEAANVVKVGGDSNSNANSNLLSSLLGEWHWKRVFRRIYEDREGHWLTPVELFQPHYSYVLGDFCAQYYERMATTEKTTTTPFEIVELGGGRGTNAKWILSYLKEHKPHVYSSLTSYTLVDSSPSLHKTQMERFLGGPHAEKVRFELKDLVDVAQGTTPLVSKSDVPTVLMGMEVLDNLPHDKIRGKIRHKLEQAEAVSFIDKKTNDTMNSKQQQQQQPKYRENFIPLSDPLLKMMLRTLPNYYTQQQSTSTSTALHNTDACWVPSIACGVLHHAIHQRPNLGLVMADFDWLPDPDLDPDRKTSSTSTWFANSNETPAEGSPIVTDMEGIDHESYLTAPPHCDILFPTDFEKLASFVKRCLSTATPTRPPAAAPASIVRRKHKNPKSKSASASPSSPPFKKQQISSNSNSSGEVLVSTTRTTTTTPVIRVEKQSQFLERWGPEHVAKTRSWLTGHTPLLHDFVNCSVLTISPEEQI
jgi:hypothetical protein